MISIICIIHNAITTSTQLESLSASVQSVVNQTYQDWELKVVCYDTLTLTFEDKRIELKTYGEEFKTYFQTLLHIVNNDAIYNYIGILDVNDIWEPNKLELQASKLKEFPRIDVIGTKSRYDTSASADLEPEIPEIPINGLYNYNLFKINPFINSSVVFKRDVLRYIQLQHHDSRPHPHPHPHPHSHPQHDIDPDKITLFCMNQLWLQLSIYEAVLYNINQVTLIHKTPYQINHYNTCYGSEYFQKVIADFKKKYIRIRFFSDFCTSETCKQNYERMCLYQKLDYYGKTNKIYFTTTETYTHVILLNCPVPGSLHVEKECVIGFAHEPPDNSFLRLYYNNFIEYAANSIGKYFIGGVGSLPSPPFLGHHGFLFHEMPKNIGSSIRSKKTNIMSIMVSHKSYTPGHKYRHALVSYILKHRLPIDIWGNGAKNYQKHYPKNNNIYGDFKSMAEMCENYMFTIAIENTSHDHYFSEKIVNPLLYDTIPLYWGCKKIEEYFPNYSIKLTGNINMDMITINRVLKNPQYFMEKHKANVIEVLDKVNLIKNVERLL